MTVPKKVTIGGIAFAVKRMKMETYGEMDFDARKIHISSDIKDDAMIIDTLKHEMLHATLAVGGHSWAKVYDEECIVRCIENIFFPAWDNLVKKHGI
jgi:hypothetical protein